MYWPKMKTCSWMDNGANAKRVKTEKRKPD